MPKLFDAEQTGIGVLLAGTASAQVPSLSYSPYSGPQTYTVGTPIAALTASNSGGTLVTKALASTLAGNGFPGFNNGAASGASFNNPYGIAVDGSGNEPILNYYKLKSKKRELFKSFGEISTDTPLKTPPICTECENENPSNLFKGVKSL